MFHPNDHFLESVDNINKCTEVFLFSGYCELTTHHNVDQICQFIHQIFSVF